MMWALCLSQCTSCDFVAHECLLAKGLLFSGAAEVLPYKRLMGMCHSMRSHFHDWFDYNGVAFSIVTRMGLHINGFLG